jgi:hypothetical protein
VLLQSLTPAACFARADPLPALRGEGAEPRSGRADEGRHAAKPIP